MIPLFPLLEGPVEVKYVLPIQSKGEKKKKSSQVQEVKTQEDGEAMRNKTCYQSKYLRLFLDRLEVRHCDFILHMNDRTSNANQREVYL